MPRLPTSIALRWLRIVRLLPGLSRHANQNSPPFNSSPRPNAAVAAVGPVAVAGILHLAILVLYLVPYHGDLSALVGAYTENLDKPAFDAVTWYFPLGHDGRYYYLLSQNPFYPEVEYVDLAHLFRARLLYPMTCWLLSGGGDPYALLWIMPLVNLLATMVTTWFGVKFALHHQRSAWWGLLLPIAVNVLLPGLRNMTDPVSMTTTVGMLVSWRLRWPTWVLMGWGIAAVLSREQNIAIVVIVIGDAILNRDYRRTAAMAVASAVWVAWLITLYWLHGKLPFFSGNTAPPFSGIYHAWTHLGMGRYAPRNPITQLLRLSVFCAELLVCLTILPRRYLMSGLLGLGSVGLAVIGGPETMYCDEWAYMRQLNWVPLAVWLWTVESGRRWPVWLLLSGALWPVIELRHYWLFGVTGWPR